MPWRQQQQLPSCLGTSLKCSFSGPIPHWKGPSKLQQSLQVIEMRTGARAASLSGPLTVIQEDGKGAIQWNQHCFLPPPYSPSSTHVQCHTWFGFATVRASFVQVHVWSSIRGSQPSQVGVTVRMCGKYMWLLMTVLEKLSPTAFCIILGLIWKLSTLILLSGKCSF